MDSSENESVIEENENDLTDKSVDVDLPDNLGEADEKQVTFKDLVSHAKDIL